MSVDSESLIDFVNFLNARKGDYPSGLALYAEAEKEIRVDFLIKESLISKGLNEFLKTKEGELLQAVVEKGLKIKLSEAGFLSAAELSLSGEMFLFTPLVIMGGPEQFNQPEQVRELCARLKKKGRPVILTAAPEDILNNNETKKEFWRDLKKVLSLIDKELPLP
jgi:hypothetical protein